MNNALNEMLEIIQLRLGTQLSELAVEARAKRKYGEQYIEFTGSKRHVPVNILLKPGVLLPNSELKLEECTVLHDQWYPVKVSTNGWIYYDYSSSGSFSLSGNQDTDFARIAQTISRLGIVREANLAAKVTANRHLALAFEDAIEELETWNISIVEYVSPNDGIESLQFVDGQDRRWSLDFSAGRVKITINGKTVGLLEHNDRFAITEIIRSKLEEVQLSRKW